MVEFEKDLRELLEKHQLRLMSPIDLTPLKDERENYFPGGVGLLYIRRDVMTVNISLNVAIPTKWYHALDSRKFPEQLNHASN